MQTSPNDETLRVYDEKVSSYIRNTPKNYDRTHAPLIKWINFFLTLIPKNGKILEIGSGPGRDAKYIRSLGYDILCSDGAPKFVAYLHAQHLNAIKLNILRDDIPEKFDLIFANAVMPHFTEEELDIVLKKIYKSLNNDGILAFNVKQGKTILWTKEKINNPRFIHQWELSSICRLVVENGYKIRKISHGIRGDIPSHVWVQLTLQK